MIEPTVAMSLGITIGGILFTAGTIYGKRTNQIDALHKKVLQLEKEIQDLKEDSNEFFIRRSDRRRLEKED